MDWIEEYAQALGEGAAVGPSERRAVLKLAREVAHRTERMNAPLAAFLVGQYTAVRRRAAGSVDEILGEASRIAEELLPPPRPDTGD
jgi:hypothetical protein